jgi:hypothetical protein
MNNRPETAAFLTAVTDYNPASFVAGMRNVHIRPSVQNWMSTLAPGPPRIADRTNLVP